MAPTMTEPLEERLHRSLTHREIIRLFTRLYPGGTIPEARGPHEQDERNRALIAAIADAARLRRLTEADLLEMLDADSGIPNMPPGGGVGTVQTYQPPYRATPAPRPTLELSPELWAALGRILNPASLAEEFCSAFLRGDMELARVLFDRLQDEGLPR